MSSPELATSFLGIRLENPLVNGSGTLDALLAGTLGLGAFVTKTVTPLPREGNAPPRLAEAPAGMLNSIGLANPGLDRFVERDLPRLAALGVPVLVSVGGFSPGDYERCTSRLDGLPGVAAIELNVSCPNVESGCISIGSDASETRALLERCRAATARPLLAKLSPSVADVAAIAVAAADGGADGLVLVNTLRGIAIDRRTLRPLLGGAGGGLSGPALKPVALHAVHRAYAATALPIVGMGGVASGQDCLELLAAGAGLVGVGTALFRDPGLPRRVLAELAALLAEHGFGSPAEALGRAHPTEPRPRLKLDGAIL